MANEYAQLDTLKRMRRIENDEDDELLNRVLTSASRRIDRRTGRRFYGDDADTPRVFLTQQRVVCDRAGELLLVDDIADGSGVAVEVGNGDAGAWAELESAAWVLEPLNAAAEVWPFTEIRRVRSLWRWNTHVRVTAKWGWPGGAPPDDIVEATLILANRLYMRKDSPEGVAGAPEWGTATLSRLDPDVESLIEPFIAGEQGLG